MSWKAAVSDLRAQRIDYLYNVTEETLGHGVVTE